MKTPLGIDDRLPEYRFGILGVSNHADIGLVKVTECQDYLFVNERYGDILTLKALHLVFEIVDGGSNPGIDTGGI